MSLSQLNHDPKLDVMKALRVFNYIMDHGEKEGEVRSFMGLSASTDFDGYTMYLNSHHAKLTVFFHNKYQLEFVKAEELDEFYTLLDRVAEIM